MLLGTLAVEAHPVTPDTFLIPTIAAEPSGSYVAANSLVIRGAEPVLVDTGCSLVAADWLRTAFSVVEPDDVRWVVISHDDHDHIGNLQTVLDLCPNATLVANWSIVSRLAGDVELPLHRMRWVDPGQSLDVGDRTLHFVRPPLFDSPATRGVFDDRTGVLWAVDTFGALVQGAVLEADDADPELYAGSFASMNTWNTPWLEWVDPIRFEAHLRTTASLPIEAIASAHGPVLRGDRIPEAFAATLALAGQPYLPTPDQSVLDAVLAVLTETTGEVAA